MKSSPILVLVRRWWQIILVAAVVGLGLGIFVGLSQPVMYATSALIHVSFANSNPLEDAPDYESKFILFGTIEKVTASEVALRSIAQKNGIDASKIDTLEKTIKVGQVETSELIKISVVAPNPKQAINIANDVAVYAREMANNRWLDQLKGIISYTERELEATQAKVEQANKVYEDARNKYNELDAQALQAITDNYTRQINEANNRLTAAQNALTKASTTIPKDNAAITFATDQVEKASRDLSNIQQASLSPISLDRRAQLDDELNRASGRSEALERLRLTRAKVDELQNKLKTAKELLNQPDLHAASVTVIESARYTEKQGDLTPFFAIGGLILGLGFGVALAIVFGGSNLEQYEPEEIAKIYQHPVLISIRLYPLSGKNKAKAAKPKVAKGATALQDSAAAAAVDEAESGAPAYLLQSFGALAGVLTERHSDQLSASLKPPAEMAASYAGGAGNSNTMAIRPDSQAPALRFLVATTKSGTGNTTLVSNVGKSLAQLGYRTLLVDGNRRNPQLLAAFGLDGKEDATDKDTAKSKSKGQDKEATPTTNMPEAQPGQIYKTDYPELDIMPYSALPVHPTRGVVRSAELSALLRSVENQYQVILCDSPALNVAADAVGLAQHFPQILFMVDGRQPKIGQDLEKLTSLTIGSAKIEGLIINQA